MMKTVILSGGRGYRLKEETDFRPKPMVMVGNKPMLWHIMKIYEHYGYRDFVLALGYMSDYVKDYFLNQRFFQYDFTLHTKTRKTLIHQNSQGSIDNFKITFVDTGLESLTGERVRRVKKYIGNKTFLLTYGDGVSDVNIKKVVAFHKRKKAIVTMTGVHPNSRWGLLKSDKRGIATEFRQKPILKNEFINGGFMVAEPEIFDYIKPNEMIEESFKRLAKIKKLAIYTHEGFWYAVDTYQNLDDLNQMWNENPAWKVWKNSKEQE